MKMFVEGEFYDVATYWHIQVPCIFYPVTRRFKASVEIATGGKFRFYFFNSIGSKEYLLSELYPSQVQYDGI